MDHTAMTQVTDADELRALLGEVVPAARDKERTALADLDRQWIAASPFFLLATAAADGTCDVSPRGDPPGSVLVLDERTLVLPERPGNRRGDGLHNVLSNPHVGLVFLLPGRGDTLRVNGRARVVRDAPCFDDLVVRGHRPVLALVVDVDQVFHHCSKAFLRSGLWDPGTWDPDALPDRAVVARTLERPQDSLESLRERYGPAYAEGLYRG